MATDVTGTFLGMKFAIPAIIKSGGGAVVNLSACNGVTGIAGLHLIPLPSTQYSG